jgi:hypothetical protein
LLPVCNRRQVTDVSHKTMAWLPALINGLPASDWPMVLLPE